MYTNLEEQFFLVCLSFFFPSTADTAELNSIWKLRWKLQSKIKPCSYPGLLRSVPEVGRLEIRFLRKIKDKNKKIVEKAGKTGKTEGRPDTVIPEWNKELACLRQPLQQKLRCPVQRTNQSTNFRATHISPLVYFQASPRLLCTGLPTAHFICSQGHFISRTPYIQQTLPMMAHAC